MRVFVLGHRGMLGHVVAAHLVDRGIEVLTSDRRYEGVPRDPLVEEVRASGAAWVVNAIGRIKQKCRDLAELVLANGRLPVHLAARLAPCQRLLHASTDCVFAGDRGGYRTTDERDAGDEYGFSKILGEAAAAAGRCQVLRVSIVGPELSGGHGLLGWFFRQAGPVNGFTNHAWNGITTLEWAKRAHEVIAGTWEPPGPLVQLASAGRVSKGELLRVTADVWGLPTEVRAVAAPDPVDRTLVGDVECPPIRDQLAELCTWHQLRFGPLAAGGAR
ncbi:MAG: sugar nucleotide-binding protein [Gemmataceae bacterium]